MKAMCPHSIPIFLGNAGIGLPHGDMPPQIRGFDVYYKFPIVIGFHVVGSAETICPSVEFAVQEIGDNGPKIVGFYAFGSNIGPCCTEPSFSAIIVQEENSPQVLGFYALAVEGNAPREIGLLAQPNVGENSPKVIGFHALGVT